MAKPENCTHKEIGEYTFNFGRLWNATQEIYKACPNDKRLAGPINGFPASKYPSLTPEACVEIASSGHQFYSRSAIWSRLTTWKFPLLQLVATFPRPPLGFMLEGFVIAHLLGDPIDSLKNLLLKLSNCQNAAGRWKRRSLRKPDSLDQDQGHGNYAVRRWKALSLVTDAYAEWGNGAQSEATLLVFPSWKSLNSNGREGCT